MRHAMVRAIMTAALIAFTLAACGGAGSTSSSNAVTQDASSNGAGVDDVTLTVPGNPSDRVTDVAAAALTEEQVEEILEKCQQGAGIPVTNDDCKRVLQLLDLPPCEPGRVCIYVGRSVADADLGVLLLHDGRPGRPACSDGAVRLCDGITVPVEVVTPLIAASPSPAPTSPAISEPADGPTESTTSTVDGDTTDGDTTDGDTMPSES